MSRRDLLHLSHAYMMVASWALLCSALFAALTIANHAAAERAVPVFVALLVAPEIASWLLRRP